jgi:hypothetical protein
VQWLLHTARWLSRYSQRGEKERGREGRNAQRGRKGGGRREKGGREGIGRGPLV